MGGIDLSVGSIVVFTGLIVALAMKNGISVIGALLIGGDIVFLNGLLILKVKLQPFVKKYW